MILITAAKETKMHLFSSTFSFLTLSVFTPCLSSPNSERQWFIRDLFSHIGRSLWFCRLLLFFFLTALEYMLVFQLTFPIFCPSCMIFDRSRYFVARTARFPAQLKMFVFFWLVEFFGVAFCLVYTLTMWIVSHSWPEVWIVFYLF